MYSLLHNNSITYVDPAAFAGLSNLQYLFVGI